MKFKQIAMFVSSAALALSLAACGGASTDQSADSGSKTYQIATDTSFAPFEYAEADGTYVGIDVEILDAIAKDQGFDYKLNPVGFDAALQNVQSNQADGIIAGMSITDERKEVFDFSEAYYDSTVCCAVKSDSDVKSLDDLKDKKVAVKNGTMSQKWAESIADKYGFTMTTFDSSDMVYEDVKSGNTVACFEDTPVMSYAISQFADTEGKNGVDFTIIDEVDSSSEFATPYGFAVNKGQNADLLKMFNDGLANIKKDGTYDKIVTKYVKSAE